MLYRLFLASCLLAAATAALRAQELNATVTVNAPQLTLIDPKVIEEFETSVRTFLNTTRFTDEPYEEAERITTNFTFTITQESTESEFVADLLVQSARPVYGTDYKTTLINWLDKPAVIEYEQFQPLEYSRTTYTSSLVALLTFYANIVIGMDADSFAPQAGEPYFRQAEQVMSVIPPNVSAKDKAWGRAGSQRSRYRLLQEILNPRARPYRQMIYDYHRQGIDVMAADAVAGRAVMGASLENLRKVRSDIPSSLLLNNFTSAKTQELLDVFNLAPPTERKAVYAVVAEVSPSNINKFRTLR